MFLICLALTGGKAQASVITQCNPDISTTEVNNSSLSLSGSLNERIYEVKGNSTITLTNVSGNTLRRCPSDGGGNNWYSFFIIRAGAVCTLVLNGNNTLSSNEECSTAIHLDAGARLIIREGSSGDRKLTLRNSTATNINIGSNMRSQGGILSDGDWEITIESGTVDVNKFGHTKYGCDNRAKNGALIVTGGNVIISEFGGCTAPSTNNRSANFNGRNGGSLTVYGGIVNIGVLSGGNGGKPTCSIGTCANDGNGGNGGDAPNVSIYGGTVNLGSVLRSCGGAAGKDGKAAGAAGKQGNLVIAGGSVVIGNTSGLVMPARNKISGTAVYRNDLTFDNTAAPDKNTADKMVLCGKIGTVPCQPETKRGSEDNGKYGLKDVRTDANKRIYIWLPATSAGAVDTVSLGLRIDNKDCTPHKHAYTRPPNDIAQTLKWGITVTYRGCQGVGCNPAFQPVTHTLPPECR